MGPSTKLSTVKLRHSTRKIFKRLGVKTVGEVAEFTQTQLQMKKGVGESTLNEIENLVHRAKLTLAEPAKNRDGISPLKAIQLEELVSPTGLSDRVFHHLRRLGIRSLYGLTQFSPEQLELQGAEGDATLWQIEKLLAHHDLSLQPGKLKRPVTECELSVRARITLRRLKIGTLGELVKKTEAELREFRECGETTFNEIKAMLDSVGLSLMNKINLDTSITALGLAPSTRAHLWQIGKRTISDITHTSEAELLRDPYIAEPRLPGIISALAEHGFSLQNEPYYLPIEGLELSIRARKALQRLGIRTLDDLQNSEVELMGTKNFGETSLNEIKSELARRGLKFNSDSRCPDEPWHSETPDDEFSGSLLDASIRTLNLSVRAANSLEASGRYSSIRDLAHATEQDLLRLRSFGQTSLREIRRALADVGLSVGCLLKEESSPDLVEKRPISDFELSIRTRNCLRQMRLTTLGELAKVTEAELLAYKGFGQTSLWEIKSLLASQGLSLFDGVRHSYRPEMVQEAKESGEPISVPQRGETPREVEPNAAHRASVLDEYGEQPQELKTEEPIEKRGGNEFCRSIRSFIRDEQGRKVEVEVTSEGGTLFITPRDHVHGNISEPDYKLSDAEGFGGHPIFLKLVNGRVKLFAFPSKANNVPMTIDMEGAKELRRW